MHLYYYTPLECMQFMCMFTILQVYIVVDEIILSPPPPPPSNELKR